VKKNRQNIHCIEIDLEAEREWARIDREKPLGQQEDEEEEENEVQWHIRRRTAGASLLHPSSSATRQPVMEPKTPPPSPPTASAESDRFTLNTSSLFLIRNEAAAIAPSHRKEEEEKQGPKGSGAAAAAAGTGREAQRLRRGVAKESSESSQSRAAGRTAGHRLAGQLHSDGSCYLLIKRQTLDGFSPGPARGESIKIPPRAPIMAPRLCRGGSRRGRRQAGGKKKIPPRLPSATRRC
jgi:hypothetical protein